MPVFLKLANNDKELLKETEKNVLEFLRTEIKVDGAYTALRTLGDGRWRGLGYHCYRLWESAKGIDDFYNHNRYSKELMCHKNDESFQMFEKTIFRILDNSLRHAAFAEKERDVKVVLFLVPASENVLYEITANCTQGIINHNLLLFAHFDFIQDSFNSSAPINVAIYGSPRQNPSCKDTRWIADRKYITDRKPLNVSEMILHRGYDLYEGTVSNFWVVRKPFGLSCPEKCTLDSCVLQTAPFQTVLHGAISQDIVEIAKSLGIIVDLNHPSILDFENWIGCFTTSKKPTNALMMFIYRFS